MNKKEAILLALFEKKEMFHGTYLAEKIRDVFKFENESILDSDNLKRYKKYMEARK